MEEYRLKDGIRAVKLDSDGHGQFTVLIPGRIVRLGGATSLLGLVDIVCDGETLSIFPEDLKIKCEKVSDGSAITTEGERNP